jgi:hypothetical protein
MSFFFLELERAPPKKNFFELEDQQYLFFIKKIGKMSYSHFIISGILLSILGKFSCFRHCFMHLVTRNSSNVFNKNARFMNFKMPV